MQEERNTIIISIAITGALILVLVLVIGFTIFLHLSRQIANKKGIQILTSNFEKNLLSTQLEIQEQTFQNISREIHDNIGLSLTLAKLNLNTIQWNQFAETQEKVAISISFISKAIEDLSYISKSLHTDYIEENGLINALDLEIKKIQKLGLFKIQYKLDGDPRYMKTQKELVIFRIIQEVLNNSIKHAQATELKLQLNYLPSQVEIELSDNGIGFVHQESSEHSKKGTGLMNLVKRASLIDGVCSVDSKPGLGTTVYMKIPY